MFSLLARLQQTSSANIHRAPTDQVDQARLGEDVPQPAPHEPTLREIYARRPPRDALTRRLAATAKSK